MVNQTEILLVFFRVDFVFWTAMNKVSCLFQTWRIWHFEFDVRS